uniref:HTH cro/C1-type domain-containing protein n=1 Tax=viral metagenome TaxID=1070528 RepID=A0A6C0EU43_9ZZZZ
MIQDWEVVVLNKDKKRQNDTSFTNVKNDDIINKKPSINFQQAMQQARMTNKMSQKDLALKMGVNVNTIVNYEKGKEIPTNLFISKLETLFKIPLPRIKAIKTKTVE